MGNDKYTLIFQNVVVIVLTCCWYSPLFPLLPTFRFSVNCCTAKIHTCFAAGSYGCCVRRGCCLWRGFQMHRYVQRTVCTVSYICVQRLSCTYTGWSRIRNCINPYNWQTGFNHCLIDVDWVRKEIDCLLDWSLIDSFIHWLIDWLIYWFIDCLLDLVGLGEKFGKERVFNTPLCEQGIAGFGIGEIRHNIDNFIIVLYLYRMYVHIKI